MTCAACESLREQNEYLKSEIARINDISRVTTFREEFHLSPRSAALLNAFYQAKGEVLTREALRNVIVEDKGERDNLVRAYLTRIREAIGQDAILNVRGSGYRLSAEALARIESVLTGDA